MTQEAAREAIVDALNELAALEQRRQETGADIRDRIKRCRADIDRYRRIANGSDRQMEIGDA